MLVAARLRLHLYFSRLGFTEIIQLKKSSVWVFFLWMPSTTCTFHNSSFRKVSHFPLNIHRHTHSQTFFLHVIMFYLSFSSTFAWRKKKVHWVGRFGTKGLLGNRDFLYGSKCVAGDARSHNVLPFGHSVPRAEFLLGYISDCTLLDCFFLDSITNCSHAGSETAGLYSNIWHMKAPIKCWSQERLQKAKERGRQRPGKNCLTWVSGESRWLEVIHTRQLWSPLSPETSVP